MTGSELQENNMSEASVNFGTGISNAFSNVATFIPKFIVFLIILIAGYFIAKALARLVSRILIRVGFDQLAERGGIKTALAHSKYDASDILAKIVYYAILLFVLDVAFGVFGSNPISGFLHGLIAYLPLLFIAVVIIVVTAAIAAAARNLIENSLSGMPYANVLGNLAWGFILALGIIAALNQLHIAQNVLNAVLYAALAALAGIAIVAVGGGGIKTMSQRWEAAASRYDAEKLHIIAARNTPLLTDQATQAMPADPGHSSHGATGTQPQPTGPHPQPDNRDDNPTGTGS
jgi:Conserved TM helix